MRLDKRVALLARGAARIPGMSQLLSKRPDRFSRGVWPGYYSRAKGAEVWDLDDNRYLDMSIGGIGATVLGYADPDVDGAVLEAIRNGGASSLNCPEEVELAELLCELHPWADMVRYTRGGGEAAAMAVRIARAATGREKVAFCGYHGWHDWYLAANLGEIDALDGHLMSGLPPAGVPRALRGTAFPFAYNDLNGLRALVDEHGSGLAAIIIEPVRNHEPEPSFLEGVRALADRCGTVLIVDEISAALRMNTGGAHLVYGLEPDMAVFSKSLGNGYPMSAVIGRAEVMEAAQKTFISSTNWTERTGPAAALATLAKHRATDAGAHLTRLGRMVQKGWRELANRWKLPLEVGGMAAMSHFSFFGDDAQARKAYFVQLMLDRGILASNLCYLMLAHTDADVARYLSACDEAFCDLARAVAEGDLSRKLRGQPSLAGFKRLA